MDIQTLIAKNNITHFYQPLYSLSDWSLYGHEALLRIRSQTTLNVEDVFKDAIKQDKLFELDMASIDSAIASYGWLPDRGYLFVNVYPTTLLRETFYSKFVDILARYGAQTDKIILEINEAPCESHALKIAILNLKKHGVKLALDDIGKGASCLQRIIELEPDIIKLDRYFAANLSNHVKKQQCVKLLTDFCETGIRVVLEGIEESQDLAVAKSLGISLGQGYLLGKPMPANLVSFPIPTIASEDRKDVTRNVSEFVE